MKTMEWMANVGQNQVVKPGITRMIMKQKFVTGARGIESRIWWPENSSAGKRVMIPVSKIVVAVTKLYRETKRVSRSAVNEIMLAVAQWGLGESQVLIGKCDVVTGWFDVAESQALLGNGKHMLVERKWSTQNGQFDIYPVIGTSGVVLYAEQRRVVREHDRNGADWGVDFMVLDLDKILSVVAIDVLREAYNQVVQSALGVC